MILSDFDLRNYIKSGRLIIEPFDEMIIRENGLDLRLSNEICELHATNDTLDPFTEVDLTKYYKCWKSDEIIIKPFSVYLLATVEYVKVPPELMAFVELRSTFARLGLSIPPTIIDGGFEGQITIELHGSTFPIRLKANIRFLHVVFSKVTSPIERPYCGKYEGQRGVRLPKLPLEHM